MKIFEFHFNPTAKKDVYFKTFSSESLYFVGELVNALPQNSDFLGKVANVAKNEYATEHNLRKTLRAVNTFLAEEVENGNIDWLGNIRASLMSFASRNGGSAQVFSFAKLGNMQVLVTRRGNLVDVGKTVHDFKNFVSGSVLPGDKIIACTKELFDILLVKDLLHDLAFFQEEKQFQKLFESKEKDLSKISGVLFSILIEEPVQKKTSQIKKKTKGFMVPGFEILPTWAAFCRTMEAFKFKLKTSFPKVPKVKIPGIKASTLKPFHLGALLPAFLFIIVLAAGFFAFEGERNKTNQVVAVALAKARALESSGKLYEAWQMLLPVLNSKQPISKEFQVAQKELEAKLIALQTIEEIKTPQLFYDLAKNPANLIPNSLLLQKNALYFSNPFSSHLIIVDTQTKKNTEIASPGNIKGGSALQNSAVFFAEPSTLLAFSPNQTAFAVISLQGLQNFHFESAGSFGKNFYVFDSKQGEIIKYANVLEGNVIPTGWFDGAAKKKAAGAKSLAVDGEIWLLANGREVQRYFNGSYKESFNLQIFPLFLQGTRLKTDTAFRYLYLMDPSQNRVIVFPKLGQNKSSKLIKQYHSGAFNDLIDFAVSADEKSMYVLNGSQVFLINL